MEALHQNYESTGSIAATVKAEAHNEVQGGSTGTLDFKKQKDLNAVTGITAWVADGPGNYSDRKVVRGIEITWKDGTTRLMGLKKGDSSVHSFDSDETVKSMSLWTGDLVDRIKIETTRTTWEQGGKEAESTKSGKTGGSEHVQKVGNGILLGFEGTSNNDGLVSLGAIFKETSDE
ncbi:hypothetical protein F5X97DRAFT_344746 [Nemania serpens]|nr:hypothetical protein F5X97DRAFT_344746 [Nemania serpens]